MLFTWIVALHALINSHLYSSLYQRRVRLGMVDPRYSWRDLEANCTLYSTRDYDGDNA